MQPARPLLKDARERTCSKSHNNAANAFAAASNASFSSAYGPPRLTYTNSTDAEVAQLAPDESESDILPFALDGDATPSADALRQASTGSAAGHSKGMHPTRNTITLLTALRRGACLSKCTVAVPNVQAVLLYQIPLPLI